MDVLIESTRIIVPTVTLPASLKKRWISVTLNINTHILYALSLALKAFHLPHLHLYIQLRLASTPPSSFCPSQLISTFAHTFHCPLPPVFLLPSLHVLKSHLAFKTQLEHPFLSEVYLNFLIRSALSSQ